MDHGATGVVAPMVMNLKGCRLGDARSQGGRSCLHKDFGRGTGDPTGQRPHGLTVVGYSVAAIPQED